MLVVRLQDLLRKWMTGCNSVEAVLEKVAMEQLLNTMPPELRVWVSERKPTTGCEAGRLADDYVQARQRVTGPNFDTKKTGGPGEKHRCPKCGLEGHLARNCPKKEAESATPDPTKTPKKSEKPPLRCYNCGKHGHISMYCLEKASYLCADGWGRSVARVGLVEGVRVSDIILNTGCSRTMVRSDLVPTDKLLPGEATTVRCAHGDSYTP